MNALKEQLDALKARFLAAGLTEEDAKRAYIIHGANAMPARKYHLLEDLGVYKASLRKNFDSNDRGTEYDDVRDLLGRRTQEYTVEEMSKLFGFLMTAHDECVLDNPEEYLPIQVHTAKMKGRAADRAIKRLNELR